MYIKARKEIAQLLGLTNTRSLFPDGAYLLWERDLLPLGSSDTFDELIPALGCRRMSAMEVRAEQDGAEPSPLPEPTDPRILSLVDAEEKGGES